MEDLLKKLFADVVKPLEDKVDELVRLLSEPATPENQPVETPAQDAPVDQTPPDAGVGGTVAPDTMQPVPPTQPLDADPETPLTDANGYPVTDPNAAR